MVMVLFCLLGSTPAQSRVDSSGLLQDLQTLSDTTMAGRLTGTRGSRMAQFYLERRFSELGLQGFFGTYEQAFFFSWRSRRIMGTNLIALITGSSDSVICLTACYAGSDSGISGPQTASGAAALLTIAGYFALHRPLHTIVFVLFDGEPAGQQGAQTFATHSGGLLEKTIALVRLEQVLPGKDGIIQVCISAPLPGKEETALLAGLQQVDCGSTPPVFHLPVPTLDFRSPDPEGLNLIAFPQATRSILDALVRLDRTLASGTTLPSPNKWIMSTDSSK